MQFYLIVLNCQILYTFMEKLDFAKMLKKMVQFGTINNVEFEKLLVKFFPKILEESIHFYQTAKNGEIRKIVENGPISCNWWEKVDFRKLFLQYNSDRFSKTQLLRNWPKHSDWYKKLLHETFQFDPIHTKKSWFHQSFTNRFFFLRLLNKIWFRQILRNGHFRSNYQRKNRFC